MTNWHVATGRNPDTGLPLDESTGAVPDELLIVHHAKGRPGSWEPVYEPLYDPEGQPLWFEHPIHGRNVDVIALPITATTGSEAEIDFYGYNPWHEDTLQSIDDEIAIDIGGPLSIIGFPFGQTGGGWLPIWIQGWVASELDVHLDGLPLFFIDARSRSGQSGSPVIAYAARGPTALVGNAVSMHGGPMERFVGVYSGRINEQSDIGRVWKRRALVDIINGATRGSPP